MNMAEMMNSLGEGCFEWRTELLLPRSVLALELLRQPAYRSGIVKFRPYVNQFATQQGPPSAPRRRRHPSLGIAKKLLDVLLAAWRAGEKLGFAEICTRAGLSKCGATRSALEMLHHQELAKREGKNRGAVYWAEGDEEHA